MTSQTWFITGANRGIGLAIARAALAAGHRVVATARQGAAVVEALLPEAARCFWIWSRTNSNASAAPI